MRRWITSIPGKPRPDGLINPLLDYDLGPQLQLSRSVRKCDANWCGQASTPATRPRGDADGNELPGVKSPLQLAPLGTYLGVRDFRRSLKGQLCNNNGTAVGGYIPFAKTKAERLASGDPRLSLEERYHTHDGYVRAVTEAATRSCSAAIFFMSTLCLSSTRRPKSAVLVDVTDPQGACPAACKVYGSISKNLVAVTDRTRHATHSESSQWIMQLEHFLAVAQEAASREPAERVCRTQPAVSQSVKKLETRLVCRCSPATCRS